MESTQKATQIDTKQVTGRRELSFGSLEELEAEVQRLRAAALAGQTRCLGNWTLGQAFGHLAAWMEYPYTGFPLKAPWFVRLMGPFMKRYILKNGLPAGYRLPGSPDGTYGTEMMSTDAGADRLLAAIARMKRGEEPVYPSPVFGRMPLDEWKRMNLDHAALHLSFVHATLD